MARTCTHVSLVLCAVALLGLLTGCNTPQVRARCHPGTFGKLSTGDQRLVLAGKVHTGMSSGAVYIAWGEPDAKHRSGDGKDPAETWSYYRRLTLQAPMDSFDRSSIGSGPFGQVTPFTAGNGFRLGGLGYEGALRYQPHLLTADDLVKRADFENGKLVRFERFQAGDEAAR